MPDEEVKAIARLVGRYKPGSADAEFVSGQQPLLGGGAVEKRIGTEGWQVFPLSTLLADGEDAKIRWILDGYLAPGIITMFTGLWKIGKTTFLTALLKALEAAQATFCGQCIRHAKVLVITEESKSIWAARRDTLKLKDHIALTPKPFKTTPSAKDWLDFIKWVAKQAQAGGYGLVILDSLPNLWGGVRDENDAAQVLAALRPLNLLTELDIAVLLVAHPKKGDASEGQATRGTGAIGGFVDIILEMRRLDAKQHNDTRRELKAYSRFDQTPSLVVVQLDKEHGTYSLIGTKSDARADDRLDILLPLLPTVPPGKLPEEIFEQWPTGGDASIPKPSVKTITRDLEAAIELSLVGTTGKGVRGDPVRYHLLT